MAVPTAGTVFAFGLIEHTCQPRCGQL